MYAPKTQISKTSDTSTSTTKKARRSKQRSTHRRSESTSSDNSPQAPRSHADMDVENLQPADIRDLQRTYGNQFTRNLIQKKQKTMAPPVSTTDIAIQRLTLLESNPKTQPLIDEIKNEYGYDLTSAEAIKEAYGRFMQQSVDPSMDYAPLFWTQSLKSLISEMKRVKQAIIARIQTNYGITIDDLAGIRAVNANYFADAGVAVTNPLNLQQSGWTLQQLESLETVLKQYSPILGPKRVLSTLAGEEQGLTNVSRVDVGLDYERYEGAQLMEQFKGMMPHLTEDNLKWIFDTGGAAGRTWLRNNSGLDAPSRNALRAAWPDYENKHLAITSGTEVDSGYADEPNVRQDPGTLGEAFRSAKNVSLYNSLVGYDGKFPGDPEKTFRQTIAHELSHALIEEHQLDHFVGQFKDYWKNENEAQDPLPANVEAPITDYGGTNAAEDLAETAGFYFTDSGVLENGNPVVNPTLTAGQPGNPAPRRKAYMDRVVSEWSSAGLKTLGSKADAFFELANGTDTNTITTKYQELTNLYDALSDEEKQTVAATWGKLSQKRQELADNAP